MRGAPLPPFRPFSCQTRGRVLHPSAMNLSNRCMNAAARDEPSYGLRIGRRVTPGLRRFAPETGPLTLGCFRPAPPANGRAHAAEPRAEQQERGRLRHGVANRDLPRPCRAVEPEARRIALLA